MELLFKLTQTKNIAEETFEKNPSELFHALRNLLHRNGKHLEDKEIERILGMFELAIQKSSYIRNDEKWIEQDWANTHRTYFVEKSKDFPEIQNQFRNDNYGEGLIYELIKQIKEKKSGYDPALRIPEVFIAEDLTISKNDSKNLKELFIRVIDKMIQDRI